MWNNLCCSALSAAGATSQHQHIQWCDVGLDARSLWTCPGSDVVFKSQSNHNCGTQGLFVLRLETQLVQEWARPLRKQDIVVTQQECTQTNPREEQTSRACQAQGVGKTRDCTKQNEGRGNILFLSAIPRFWMCFEFSATVVPLSQICVADKAVLHPLRPKLRPKNTFCCQGSLKRAAWQVTS